MPTPLNAAQTAELVELLKNPPADEGATLLDMFTNRVPPGVDEASYVKAAFLADVANGSATCPLIDPVRAVELLGTMQGGYNVAPMVEALDDPALAETAADMLSYTRLVFDASYDVESKVRSQLDL